MHRNKPFAVPGVPPPQGVVGHVSPSSPVGDIEMVDMSPQARAASAGGNFEVEHLDSSPGSTLRSRSRNANNRDDLLDESIDILTESPGNRNRRRNVTRESQEVRKNLKSHRRHSAESASTIYEHNPNHLKTFFLFPLLLRHLSLFLSCDPGTMARSDRQS